MQKSISKYSAALTVMAEPMRQTILSMIGSSGKLRGKDLLERLDLTQPTLSHHMNVLLGAGLISSRKEGRCVWYSINKTMVTSIAEAIMSLNVESGVEVVAPTKVASKPAKTTRVSKSVSVPDMTIVTEEPSKDKKEKVKDKDKDKDKKKKKKSKDKEKDKSKKKKK